MPTSRTLEDLVNLFNVVGKKNAEAVCRKLTIRSEDFANVVLAVRVAGLGRYQYACHFAELSSDTLAPSKDELQALGLNGIGRLNGKGLKAARKIDQLFNVRRLLSVHLFYSRSQKYWHMFYFDQRDYSAVDNHWVLGPHIHYSQDTFTRESLADVWHKIHQDKPNFPKSIHVRYDYHHNRNRYRAT